MFVHRDRESALEGGFGTERAQQARKMFETPGFFCNGLCTGALEAGTKLREMIDAPLQHARWMVRAVCGAGVREACGE